ncbi:chemotaxis protein CheW [Luteimonas deserti]|uniref:Chemotaxis protein CheW n=1 Tax=Luteimonas deserti TaxID=2752306 RepID=A0A7Z0TUW9_9GAMM|nr:chemotaxis protein CheW [Luteimonas deserti]NYZ61609.1 chemotaxis protein CheW [Luteimonas deserti]
MNATLDDIRGVLIRVGATQLLLPNATISEVLSYSPPEPVDDAPGWLLGRLRWRGWRLPLVAFPVLSGQGEDQAGLGSKVVVFKALSGDARLPFFALLTQGFPRLVTISAANLLDESHGDDEALPFAVSARVRLNDDVAQIPDIDQIERSVREAIAA